ncbi:MAG: hypothetical protein PHU72_10350, partial [Dethiosulfovibrio sp.]|nr:hypothetical protein [Dethiosulfovibrio sp.]
MIKKMIRVAIWGLMSRQREIVSFLHDEGLLHLEYSDSVKMSAKDSDSLRLLRGKLMGMIELLGWDGWDDISDGYIRDVDAKLDLPFSQLVTEIDGSLDHFKSQLSALFEEQESLKRLKNRLKKNKEIIYRFKSFVEEHSRENRSVSLWWVKSDKVADVVGQLQSNI